MIAELKIVIGDDGSMQVTGPIHDKEWCLRCLDMAKDTVKNYKVAPLIIPPDYIDKQILNIKTLR